MNSEQSVGIVQTMSEREAVLTLPMGDLTFVITDTVFGTQGVWL